MRGLTPEERSRHTHVPAEDRERARIVVVPRLTPGVSGMTIGRYVLLRRGREDDQRLLAHELVHVRQWREQGIVRFLWRYTTAYLGGRRRGSGHRAAYLAIPFEAEARDLGGG